MPPPVPARFAAVVLLGLALVVPLPPAAAQAPGPAAPGTLDGSAAVDRVIDVYTALEAAWQAERRCRLLAPPARRELDWLEDALDRVVRDTFSAETRARLGELAARMAAAAPLDRCGTAARRYVDAAAPAAAHVVATIAGRRYRGRDSYRDFLADSYFQARAAFAADVRCRDGRGRIAAEPAARDALARAAETLSAALGTDRVATLDAEAEAAAEQATCGPWLGQAVSDAHAQLDRLQDALARDEAAAAAEDEENAMPGGGGDGPSPP